LTNLRQIARKIPGATRAYRVLRGIAIRTWSRERIFTDIFRGNKFGGTVSVSGIGSDLQQTRVLIYQLPDLLRKEHVRSVLDIPCGDFFWMRHVDLTGIDYLGADIVKELIERNQQQHQRGGVRFQRLDLVKDRLPEADLVLCRDCIVHLSFAEARRALLNICASRARLLLTTTFPDRKINVDIRTGDWRTLNLVLPPFSLPPPMRLVNEGCTEGYGAYADKSLGLWRVEDVAKALLVRRHDQPCVPG
jgi:SAM-dependent methyltransferase